MVLLQSRIIIMISTSPKPVRQYNCFYDTMTLTSLKLFCTDFHLLTYFVPELSIYNLDTIQFKFICQKISYNSLGHFSLINQNSYASQHLNSFSFVSNFTVIQYNLILNIG